MVILETYKPRFNPARNGLVYTYHGSMYNTVSRTASVKLALTVARRVERYIQSKDFSHVLPALFPL